MLGEQIVRDYEYLAKKYQFMFFLQEIKYGYIEGVLSYAQKTNTYILSGKGMIT